MTNGRTEVRFDISLAATAAPAAGAYPRGGGGRDEIARDRRAWALSIGICAPVRQFSAAVWEPAQSGSPRTRTPFAESRRDIFYTGRKTIRRD